MVQVKDQMSSKGEQAAAVEESSNSVVSNAISLEEAQKQFGVCACPCLSSLCMCLPACASQSSPHSSCFRLFTGTKPAPSS